MIRRKRVLRTINAKEVIKDIKQRKKEVKKSGRVYGVKRDQLKQMKTLELRFKHDLPIINHLIKQGEITYSEAKKWIERVQESSIQLGPAPARKLPFHETAEQKRAREETERKEDERQKAWLRVQLKISKELAKRREEGRKR